MDLHGRSLLKEIDFTKEEFVSLVDLAERAPPGEAHRDRGAADGRAQHRPHLREGLHPHPVGLRGRRPRPGGARHLSRARGVPDRPQGDDQGHRPGARADVRRHRVPGFAQETVEILARYAGVPVWNGLTDEWHPTQMLADVLTMRDHSANRSTRSPTATWATPATTRRTRCWSPARCSAWTSAWPRPRRCWPSAEVRAIADGWRRLGRPATVDRRRRPRRSGADFLYTDVWVSMGEPAADWGERIDRAAALPGQRGAHEGDRQPGREVHALPPRTAQRRDRGRRAHLRQNGACPPSRSPTRSSSRPPRSSSTRPRTGSTPSRRPWSPPSGTEMRLVVAVGGNALLERGEVPLAEIQEKHVDAAVEAPGPAGGRPRPGDHPRERATGGPAGQRERRRSRSCRVPIRSTCSAPRPRG